MTAEAVLVIALSVGAAFVLAGGVHEFVTRLKCRRQDPLGRVKPHRPMWFDEEK